MATDIDVLLVGPGGQSVILMSDVGGGTPLSNVTLTLDDAASASLPGTAIATGTYQPTNGPADACGEDAFDAPAPTGSYGSTLSVFNGTIPNGTWSLYVVDDCSGDLGEISGGWSLEITVADAEDNEPPVLTVPDDITVSTDPGQPNAIVTFSATATDNSGSATVTCLPASGSSFAIGTTTVNCTATDAAINSDSDSFTVTVTDGEAPVLTVPDDITVPARGPGGAIVSFTVVAADNAGPVTAMCTPASGSLFAPGETLVTCNVTDDDGNSVSDTFTVTVLGAGDLLAQLRAETIARVDNPFFERSMVLVLNLSSRLNSQGRPELTQLYLRYYDFQLSLGTALRLIPTDDAAQLRMLLAQVRDAMS